MALAETILRKVHKLGLVPKIIRALPLVSLFLAVASVAWLAFLPVDGQYRNTYISENALMPGQVTSYFRESEWNHVRGFRSEVVKWDFDAVSLANPTLELWLEDFGLTVSHHHDAKTNLTTMYLLMHAPRGDDTEALVLVVPYFTADGEANVGGFALGPALARYFSRLSIWLKNIILVFPRDGKTVLRLWVGAYHTTLDDTAGSIDAAIVMEYPSELDGFDHMELYYEGLNGQLPNLDLINTATTIARHESMRVSVQGINIGSTDYWSRVRVLAWGILRLAVSGFANRAVGCESFSGWQIQAITIRAVSGSGPDITQFGRIVDSTFRSVNNLLEKFHQSFFFYLLLSPTNFVSIGTYLPAAVLVGASFAVSSLYTLANGVSPADYIANLGVLVGVYTAIELVCAGGAFLLQHVVLASEARDVCSATIVAALGTVTLAAAGGSLLRGSHSLVFSRAISYMLIAFSLYFIAMLITSLLIVHFALALTIGICALPLTFVTPLIQSGNGVKSRVKIAVALLASSPVTALIALGYFVDGGEYEGVVSVVKGLLTSWHELQSWTWFVVALGWFPSWACVALACTFGDFSEEKKKAE